MGEIHVFIHISSSSLHIYKRNVQTSCTDCPTVHYYNINFRFIYFFYYFISFYLVLFCFFSAELPTLSGDLDMEVASIPFMRGLPPPSHKPSKKEAKLMQQKLEKLARINIHLHGKIFFVFIIYFITNRVETLHQFLFAIQNKLHSVKDNRL